MKQVYLLAAVAGSVMTAAAMAQELPALPFGGEVVKNPIGTTPGGFVGRAIQPVYDCLSNSFGNGSATHLGTCSNVLEDVSFTNGPWATGTSRAITSITYGVGVIATPTTAADEIVIIFWPQTAANFLGMTGTGSSMIDPAATPLAVVRVDGNGLGAGFYWQITNNLATPVAIPDGDSGCFVQIAWVTNAGGVAGGYQPTTSWANIDTNATGGLYQGCASTTDRAIVFGSNSGLAYPGNPASPGTTTTSYGRDISNATMCPSIGQFIGAPLATGGNVEHRAIAASPARGLMLRLSGDVVVPPPAVTGDLGCVPDSGASVSSTVAAGEIKWYSMCLNGDANDNARQFCDIDTETSSGDVAIGIFNDGGVLIANDNGSGSGTADQLTFGTGIRESFDGVGGEGQQYNGRSGQLLAGTYYIAVGSSDASFGAGFTATGGTVDGGSFNLRVATNTNGSALAAPVTPAVDAARALGALVSPGAAAPAIDTGLRGTRWYSFQVDFDTSCSQRFLDIAFNGSGHTPTADTEAFVFNSSGNLVATDDDSGTAALSQLSFATPAVTGGPAARPGTGGDGVDFDGQSGNIAPGTYYMAVGLWDVTTLAANDRFHVRGTSGSNLQIAPTFSTDFDGTNGCGGTCPPCAADFNQDGGVDGGDIESFFGAWEGGDACGDVNQDGGVDGGDIESFFGFWEAGGC